MKENSLTQVLEMVGLALVVSIAMLMIIYAIQHVPMVAPMATVSWNG